jgi:hypothetical protein
MQARIWVLAFLERRIQDRERTNGDEGEFPSDRESNDTCSDQSYDSGNNARGSLDSNYSNSVNHIRSKSDTSKPADLLWVFTQASCYGSGLQR